MSNIIVSGIQTNLYWEDKQANLHMLTDKVNSIPSSDIIILPEMFSTGFSMNPQSYAEDMQGETIRWMQDMARKKSSVLAGSIIIQEEHYYYNRFLWVQPDGSLQFYDKRHLFAFAGEDQHYQAGNKRIVIAYKGWKFLLQVCYDLRFPVWCRQATHLTPEYDGIIYVANWPQRRVHAWKTLLQSRAIENQCFVLGINRVGTDGNQVYHSGDSMVVDPLGETLFHQADDEVIFTLSLDRGLLSDIRFRLPFLKDADLFTIAD
jgi:predicted amidohydrolase